MKFLIGLVAPILLQTLLVFIVIMMNTGNGSWIGLGVFLVAIFAIPATAIANLFYILSNNDRHYLMLLKRCYVTAAVVPLITVPVLFLL